jgi:hypothetical protein
LIFSKIKYFAIKNQKKHREKNKEVVLLIERRKSRYEKMNNPNFKIENYEND